MEEKKSKLSILTNGIIKENPVLVLLLGCCSVLATSSDAINALGMSVAFSAVMIMSNIVISAIRKIIPDNVRIPCFIVVIAGFVTVVQMMVQAFAPSLYQSLGLFIPLIVVNCIILGRAEMFASKNGIFDSFLDGVGMSIGYTVVLVALVNHLTKDKSVKVRDFGEEDAAIIASAKAAEKEAAAAKAAAAKEAANAEAAAEVVKEEKGE